MKTAIICTILLFESAICARCRTVTEQKVIDLTAKAIVSDLSLANGEDSATVINKLDEIAKKKIDRIGTALIGRESAEIVLLRLGYEPAIRRSINEFRKYDVVAWREVTKRLEWSSQPAIIPYLAEDFFLDEDPKQGVGISNGEEAVGAPPRSIFAAVVAGRIIHRASEFSPEMKRWADTMYELRLADPGQFRAGMKQWWIQNKDAFAKKDYSHVQPLADSVVEPDQNTIKQDVSPSQDATIRSPATALVLPTEVQPAVSGRSRVFFGGIAIAGASFLIVAMTYIRRRRL